MTMFLTKHAHMFQSNGKYVSEEYLRGFPAAVTAASSGEEEPGPALPPEAVVPRRDRSLTRSPSPMDTAEVCENDLDMFFGYHAHGSYWQTPLTDAAAVTELLKSLDTNNNGKAVATVQVMDGESMKDVPVVRTYKNLKFFPACCDYIMLTSKIAIPDQVMDLAKEAGVSLDTDLTEVPAETNVVLPDGTIVSLPAKPDSATRYSGHVTLKTCSRF